MFEGNLNELQVIVSFINVNNNRFGYLLLKEPFLFETIGIINYSNQYLFIRHFYLLISDKKKLLKNIFTLNLLLYQLNMRYNIFQAINNENLQLLNVLLLENKST